MVTADLRGAAARGVRWTALSQGARQVVQLASLVILARLLDPSDFGVISMATVVTGFANMLRDFGTGASVIQRPQVEDRFLSSIFWTNVGTSTVLALLVMAVSPLVAIFYREPLLVPILLALALAIPISVAAVVPQALLERRLEFEQLGKAEAVAVICGATASIVTAVLGGGVWSLVAQTLVTATVGTTLVWRASHWRPRLQYHWGDVRAIGSFGLHLTGYGIFNYFARNADYLLIGRFLGPRELGVYTIAYRLMLYPLQTVTAVAIRVLFPALSRVQEDPERTRRAYLEAVHTIAVVTFPVMSLIWASAGQLTPLLLGGGWAGIGILVRLLAPVGLLQSVSATVGAIYQARGRADLLLYWGAASGTLTVLGFVVGLRGGVEGVALSYLITTLVLVGPSFAIPLRLIGLRVADLVPALWRPATGSAVMIGVLTALTSVLDASLSRSVQLGAVLGVGVAVYLTVAWFVDRPKLKELSRLAMGLH